MVSLFKKYFLSEKQIFFIIILSSLVIFLQQCFRMRDFPTIFIVLSVLDGLCTLIFTLEMIVKIQDLGLKGYLKDRWNIMDGILVIISLPAVIQWFLPHGMISFTFLKILRILRIFRFFRLIRIFPNFEKMLKNFSVALRQSYVMLIGMVIFLLIFSIIGSELFREYDAFKTPLDSIYTTFRLFSGEGWNEIPDSIAAHLSNPVFGYLVRFYFSFLLILGCFIGMSMLNSIFVDAMVKDNNNDVKDELRLTQERLANIEEKLNKLLANIDNNPTNKE